MQKISDTFIDAQSLEAKFNDLENKLSSISVNEPLELKDIIFILKQIIYFFGGKKASFEVTLTISSQDIVDSRNFIYFQPFISNESGKLKINWGDNITQEYDFSDIIYHAYTEPGSYVLTFENVDDVTVATHRQTESTFVIDNEFDNTVYSHKQIPTLINNIDQSYNNFVQIVQNSTISKNILENTPVNIKFGTTIEKIADQCFKDNDKLYQVVFDKSIASDKDFVLGKEAFANCTHLLGNIALPENCVEIGDDAFANCHSIYSITIPKSCTKIGKGAFFNCPSLTYLTFKDRTSTEVKDFIDANTESGSMVWFAANNVPKIQSDETIGNRIKQEFISFVETLPVGTSELAKSYMFRKHILDKFKTYDFSADSFVYLKYLTNTTPEYINLYDYSSLYYSMPIINTVVEENSKERLRLFKASNGQCQEYVQPHSYSGGHTNTCPGGSGHTCNYFTCSGDATLNACRSSNNCITEYKCSDAWQNTCTGQNGCDEQAGGFSCTGSGVNRCYVANSCIPGAGTGHGCSDGAKNTNDEIVCNDFSCSDFYRDGGNPNDTNNMSGNIGVGAVGTGRGGYSGTTVLV